MKRLRASRCAFVPEVQKQLQELDEGAAIKVEGVLRASRGSGDMYLSAERLEVLRGGH